MDHHQSFKGFLDSKDREAKKQLKIVKKLLESKKMKVKDFLEEDDPYVFLYAPSKDVSFDGIRIYKIGNQLAFRVQKEAQTHPFGRAYPLDIEAMFNDLLSDHHKPEKAGEAVIDAVIEEIGRFFKKSAEAEKALRNSEFEKGAIVIQSGPTDYANLVFSRV